ncbi:hypothetical protein SAMN05421753_10910 [Planctomicrobium piriforme]|uniref:Tetratricopeptide repeat-containing protein n=2 Tax=Planctomicrobium piriforme TaxID=1576369 RepID=A0A1I3I8D5_9PLAN|nr:hypothetical protein SAMN05421753_10910 [Planctomicrobium piriforme]
MIACGTLHTKSKNALKQGELFSHRSRVENSIGQVFEPMKIASLLSVSAAVLFVAASSVHAADLDTVFRRGDTKGFSGQLTTISKTEVVVTQKVGNKEEHIPANEISKVEFQGEPPMLNLARGNEAAGRLQEAMAGYQEAIAAGGSDNVKAEVNFLLARTLAKLAQSDPTKAAAAIEKLNGLTNSNRDHYRYYPVQQLLAETALLVHDHVTAESAFDRLSQAPWLDYQMAGKNGTARTLIDQKKVAEAKAIFDELAAAKAASPTEKNAQLEAMLGQAECLQMQNEVGLATEVLQKVVNLATAEDPRVLAQTYLQLGNAYLTDGQKNKDALLAFLHVDVIPTLAAQADLHAEALYQLSKLWPAVGQPARGAEASAKLQQEYPESEWAKKLAAGQ